MTERLRRRGHDLVFHEAPDLKGMTMVPGRKPVDFVYLDRAAGNARWNVEIKRLVPRHVRQQEAYSRHRLAALQGRLPGVYTVTLRIDSADRRSRVDDHATV